MNAQGTPRSLASALGGPALGRSRSPSKAMRRIGMRRPGPEVSEPEAPSADLGSRGNNTTTISATAHTASDVTAKA